MKSRSRPPTFSVAWLSLLIVSIDWLSACSHEKPNMEGVLVPPVVLPFDLSHAGAKLDMEMFSNRHRQYIFSLTFHYQEEDKADYARVKRLTGGYELDKQGNAIKPGIPTPVRLIIAKSNEPDKKIVYDQTVLPVLTTWGSGTLTKNFAYITLDRGATYHVQLQNLKDSPELVGTPITVSVHYYARGCWILPEFLIPEYFAC